MGLTPQLIAAHAGPANLTSIPDATTQLACASGRYEDIIAGWDQWAFTGFVMKIMGFLHRTFFALLASHLAPLTPSVTVAAPNGFPESGNGLWYTEPGSIWVRHFLPIGNGYLAAMIPGGVPVETSQLNIETLWSGGPFQDPNYNGGNKDASQTESLAETMAGYHEAVFAASNGEISNVSALQEPFDAYGSYAGAGWLVSSLTSTGSVTDYARWLDLDEGFVKASWTQGNISFLRTSFCSHPAKACVEHTASTDNTTSLPDITYAYSSELESGMPSANVSCFDNSTLLVRGTIGSPGMIYEFLFQADSTSGTVFCSSVSASNASLTVSGGLDAWVAWVGDTDYSIDAGTEDTRFSFKGEDPHDALVNLLSTVSTSSYDDLLSGHAQDYHATMSDKFSLDIGQTPDLYNPTDVIMDAYQTNEGNPYIEWLLFNFGRYLLASSARGVLPANLQGKWAKDIANAWSADYHADINVQMNYWAAEITDLDVTQSLWDYMAKTWAPRGTQTAQILYNSRGWVTHVEMNIFGHTGMKTGDAQWANYPEANAWMSFHVWDHFDHTNDVDWWKSQGWPLLKGIALFHLDKLIPDEHFNDSTLVVAPCNSPEQRPITFGCAHSQQMIWQLLNAAEKGFEASGDTDTAFLDEVRSKRDAMDKGIHIGSWSQLQEWKIDRDDPSDTHRHLSHLVGLYPGYAIANFNGSIQTIPNHSDILSKEEVWNATKTSLVHRGNGTGPDADSGWEKVWRAAAWAQLLDSEQFYFELSYSVFRNFGANLLSLYDPDSEDAIFQIDANLGYPGAVMNALLQAPDVPSNDARLRITILPALPSQWASGRVRGARVRRGITVDIEWADTKPTKVVLTVDKQASETPVDILYAGRLINSFMTSAGQTTTVEEF